MRWFLLVPLFLLFAGCGEKTPSYGRYSIGRDKSWFPMQFNQKKPNLNAFTNALVEEIAKIEHVPMHVVDIGWAQLFQRLENKEVSGIFTSLSPTVITEGKYSFSDPFLLLGPVLVVPKDSKATSLVDLSGKIIAVNQFDDSVLIVQRYPSIIIKLYQNVPSVLEDLSRGKIDGALVPVLEAYDLVPSVDPQLKIVTLPLNHKALRLITLKGKNKKLLKHFNNGLQHTITSSRYQTLRTIYAL
jgi:polar amino acid transport system substrate-binding protein